MNNRNKNNGNLFSSKKGNVVVDLVLIFLILTILSLGLFYLYGVQDTLEGIVVNDPDMSDSAKAIVEGSTAQSATIWDAGLIALLIGMWLSLLVSSVFIDSHPIFFIAFLIGLVVVLVILVTVANVHHDITTEETQDARDAYPKIVWVMDHIMEMMIFVALSVGVVMFGKFWRGF